MSIAEAAAAGALPIVPNRLAYPELLNDAGDAGRQQFFYEVPSCSHDTVFQFLSGL